MSFIILAKKSYINPSPTNHTPYKLFIFLYRVNNKKNMNKLNKAVIIGSNIFTVLFLNLIFLYKGQILHLYNQASH